MQLNLSSSLPTQHHTTTPGVIDVYVCSFSSLSQQTHLTPLPSHEQAYSQRFPILKHRQAWQLSHQMLRHVLAAYSAIPPQKLLFQRTSTGKPKLRGKTGLHFSLSHTAHFSAVAIANQPVGVDIEEYNDQIEYEQISKLCFSAKEQHSITAAENPRRAFYRQWVAKEASIKCLDVELQTLNAMSHGPPVQTFMAAPNIHAAVAWR